MDPLGHVDGMNLFTYVKNDPVSYTDPSGLDVPGCDLVPSILETGCHLECWCRT